MQSSEIAATHATPARPESTGARRAGIWALRHAPELALFLLGVILRLSMHFSYGPLWSYDADSHWEVVQWIAQHNALPEVDALLEAFHPPLYYVLAAVLVKQGAGPLGVQWISILSGIIKLGLLWWGFNQYLTQRGARIAALALAAILPVSVHIDGSLNAEALSGMLATAALVLTPKAFGASGRTRWLYALAIGVLLGVQLLTKVSALVVIASIGSVAALEVVLARDRTVSERIRRALPWSLLVLVPALMNCWLMARDVRAHGKPFLTSFDAQQKSMAAATDLIPYLDRRSLGFVLGWDPAVFVWPYSAAGLEPSARFFSVVTVATFVDYWNYSFSGIYPVDPTSLGSNGRPLTYPLLKASQRSAVAGTLLSVAAAIAWFHCLRKTFTRREWGLLALLITVAAAVVSTLHFAIKYPLDNLGVVKSSYLQFGTAPLYATLGLAIAWSAETRRRWPILGILLLSLWAVAAYTLYCRLGLPLLPL